MSANASLIARSLRSWMSRDGSREGPRWLLWLWTLLFCIGVALGFTLLGMAVNAGRGGHGWTMPGIWARFMGINLVVSCTIGFIIHGLFDLLIPWVGADRIRRFTPGQRGAFFTAIPLLGVSIGWPLAVWLVGDAFGGPRTLGGIAGSFAIALLVSFVIYLVFSAKAQQIEAEKRAVESQLRLLQAQMEPHFLFNTLANVLTLIDAEPQRAKRMLESFTDYLRATLAGLRQAEGSLGGELDLAEAYLQLLQLRMEDRLRYDIAADAPVRAAALPPLMLQPLVENAIHHGLEPKLEGGTLSIRASVQGGVLQVTVSDDGLGPDAPQRRRTGNGIALDNLRQRLQALYGDAASLTIEPLQPGTRATLRLPCSIATSTTTDAAATPCPSP
jgi:signal transduction histidine kinase